MNNTNQPIYIMKNIITLLAVITLIFSCNNQVNIEEEKENLMQFSKDWSDLIKAGDIDKIMEGWANNAVMMAPGLPPLRGRDAIRNYVEEGAKIPGFAIRWEPLEAHVSKSGDMAYLIERNEIIINDSLGNPVKSYNKVVTIWKKQSDGQWKNVVDMWNADPKGDF